MDSPYSGFLSGGGSLRAAAEMRRIVNKACDVLLNHRAAYDVCPRGTNSLAEEPGELHSPWNGVLECDSWEDMETVIPSTPPPPQENAPRPAPHQSPPVEQARSTYHKRGPRLRPLMRMQPGGSAAAWLLGALPAVGCLASLLLLHGVSVYSAVGGVRSLTGLRYEIDDYGSLRVEFVTSIWAVLLIGAAVAAVAFAFVIHARMVRVVAAVAMTVFALANAVYPYTRLVGSLRSVQYGVGAWLTIGCALAAMVMSLTGRRAR